MDATSLCVCSTVHLHQYLGISDGTFTSRFNRLPYIRHALCTNYICRYSPHYIYCTPAVNSIHESPPNHYWCMMHPKLRSCIRISPITAYGSASCVTTDIAPTRTLKVGRWSWAIHVVAGCRDRGWVGNDVCRKERVVEMVVAVAVAEGEARTHCAAYLPSMVRRR